MTPGLLLTLKFLIKGSVYDVKDVVNPHVTIVIQLCHLCIIVEKVVT